MAMNRLEAAGILPENQDPAKQPAIGKARELPFAADVKYPGMPVAVPDEEQTATTPVETKPVPQEFRPFTDQEREALIKDGAVILDLYGDTIEQEQQEGRLFRYVTSGGDRLLNVPSIIAQVAIFPDREKFFIPNSGNKNLAEQEELAKEDGRKLRERLGLEDDGLDVIIPDQASTLTEVIFRYLDETTKTGKGVWLFGPEYNYLYGRTQNPVNESGSFVAGVGGAGPGLGVYVGRWPRDDGHGDLRVVRLVVAKKK